MNRATAITLAVLAGLGLLLLAGRAGAAYFDPERIEESENLTGKNAGASFFEGTEIMTDQNNRNLSAFLALIRQVESNNDYQALVMGGSFSDFSNHPALLGWAGVRLDDGRLTTAAGAYQITRTTWKDLGGATKYGSFDPAAQDAAAIDLLRRRGALTLVMNGHYDAAMMRLTNEWEAFERILAGTFPVTPDGARTIYADAGGTFA